MGGWRNSAFRQTSRIRGAVAKHMALCSYSKYGYTLTCHFLARCALAQPVVYSDVGSHARGCSNPAEETSLALNAAKDSVADDAYSCEAGGGRIHHHGAGVCCG